MGGALMKEKSMPVEGTELMSINPVAAPEASPAAPSKEIDSLTRESLAQLFPKTEHVAVLPTVQRPLQRATSSGGLQSTGFASLENLVEEVFQKIWPLVRAQIRNLQAFDAVLEESLKEAVKAQVRLHCTGMSTVLHVASIASGIGFGYLFVDNLTQGFAFRRFAGAVGPAQDAYSRNLEHGWGMIKATLDAGTGQQASSAGADRTQAEATAALIRTRLDRLRQGEDESRGQRTSLMQMIQQANQQNSEARRSIR